MARRRDKFADRNTPKVKAKIVKFDPAEDWKSRHERRLTTNLAYEATMREWCEMHRIVLGIFNNGHHWKMTLVDGRVVEWWPSSAKLVFFKQYRGGWHVHDYMQAMAVMSEKLGLASGRSEPSSNP